MQLTIPPDYRSILDVAQTEQAIKLVKDFSRSTWHPHCGCAG